MARLNFDEMKLFDDTMDDMDVIRNIANKEFPEKALYVTDIGKVIKKHDEWIAKMPRVVPHFAVKCNPHPTVIKILAALGVGFDCASELEMKLVTQHGVQGDRIIFAQPAKLPSHIVYAKKVGIEQMTVDSESELYKIKDLFPEAKIVIRICCDAENTPLVIGSKFGCEPIDEAVRLIQLTKDLDLNLHGFSFHVGSLCGEPESFGRGIAICKELIATSKSIGCDNVRLIDIGGGFSGDSGTNIDKFANIINEAIRNLDPTIRVISEPGRYYVFSSVFLVSYLHSKRVISKNDKIIRMYYMNCGVFSSFLLNLVGLRPKLPRLLCKRMSDDKFCSILWGPTLAAEDIIAKDVLLPELHVGDQLVWEDMGAYTLTTATKFNGFSAPVMIPFIRKSQWKDFKARINLP